MEEEEEEGGERPKGLFRSFQLSINLTNFHSWGLINQHELAAAAVVNVAAVAVVFVDVAAAVVVVDDVVVAVDVVVDVLLRPLVVDN